MSSVPRLQLIATLFLCTLSDVVLLQSAAWAGTLDVTCDDKFDEIDLGALGTIPGFLNVCSNDDMTAVETVVNGHHTEIFDIQNVNITQGNKLIALTTVTNSHTSQINGQSVRISQLFDRTDELYSIADNHEDRISQLEGDFLALSGEVTGLRTDMNAGLAMANAMEVFLPDPGASFRLNVGIGHFGGTNAFGITGTGRIDGNGTAVYFGASKVSGSSLTAGKAGISFQW